MNFDLVGLIGRRRRAPEEADGGEGRDRTADLGVMNPSL